MKRSSLLIVPFLSCVPDKELDKTAVLDNSLIINQYVVNLITMMSVGHI